MVILLVVAVNAICVNGQQKSVPYVILISFDGFRSDYTEHFNLPNFKAFIKDGASSEGLIPSFPSKTFPNHYTLVTGLYPGHHGLVDNNFFDPEKQEVYSMRIRKTLTDSSYYGGVPLWKLAKQRGIRSASYFWVGSELKEEGLHPDYYFEYDQSVPFPQRIDKVISWLKLPEKERPHLITLYFSSPDTESHTFGPLAKETEQAVMSMDSLLGDFMHRLGKLRLPINIFLVSDHGMLEIAKKEENYIFLDELILSKEERITVVNSGTQAHIYCSLQGQRDSIYNILKKNEKNFSVLKSEDFPHQWYYEHARSGDLLLVADPGKYIVTGDRKSFVSTIKEGEVFGTHGYDPQVVREMYGIFYAKGPNIKKGTRISAFQNIHVYPLIAKILGLEIPPIDGTFDVLQPVYKK